MRAEPMPAAGRMAEGWEVAGRMVAGSVVEASVEEPTLVGAASSRVNQRRSRGRGLVTRPPPASSDEPC